MTDNKEILIDADFNPKMKGYLLLYTSLIFLITIVGIPFVIIWILIAPHFIGKYFERLDCKLTTRSLMFSKGFIVRTERTIPLDKIQDLTFKEGPLLKAFGLSILRVETAGNAMQCGADLSLIGIVGAKEFRNKVLEQRDLVTSSGSNQATLTEQASDESLIEVLKDIRTSLANIENKMKD